MNCQFCGTRVRGSIYRCKNCKPKIIYADFDEPNLLGHHAKQMAVVIQAYGKKYSGYLPLEQKQEESDV